MAYDQRTNRKKPVRAGTRFSVLFLCGLAAVHISRASSLPAQSPATSSPVKSPVAPPAITQVLREVEANYNRMKTMKAQFRQIVREGARTTRQETGTLYLSK